MGVFNLGRVPLGIRPELLKLSIKLS